MCGENALQFLVVFSYQLINCVNLFPNIEDLVLMQYCFERIYKQITNIVDISMNNKLPHLFVSKITNGFNLEKTWNIGNHQNRQKTASPAKFLLEPVKGFLPSVDKIYTKLIFLRNYIFVYFFLWSQIMRNINDKSKISCFIEIGWFSLIDLLF